MLLREPAPHLKTVAQCIVQLLYHPTGIKPVLVGLRRNRCRRATVITALVITTSV